MQRRARWVSVAVVMVLAAGSLIAAHLTVFAPTTTAAVGRRCPWVAASRAGNAQPAVLAAEVESKMTLEQKVSFVVLVVHHDEENVDAGIPSLCIPPLLLSDGPNGIAYGAPGATQLPASIGQAATFDPAVTYATGRLEGEEARTKGIDVVQGPELNLARVPQSGRIFEAFGEDPDLTAAMGASSVEGIQSQGVMASIKHLTAYNEEIDRVRLNQDVSLRALEELYDAPFASVIEAAHPASVMCSYGELNGINTCSDPFIYHLLESWGFHGFVRSDLTAVPDAAAAFKAGMDLIKPADIPALVGQVRSGALPMADINTSVKQILATMFAFGLIAQPRRADVGARATSPAHSAVALSSAEQSMVLLKNRGGVLPLAKAAGSLAVIGADAGSQATTSGRGSSHVRPSSSIVTPLAGLHTALGKRTKIRYVSADSPSLRLPPVSGHDLVSGSPLPAETPKRMPRGRVEPGKRDLRIDLAPNVTPAAATASVPGAGPGWSVWQAVLRAPKTGTYEISVEQVGDTWLYVNGSPVIASRGLHADSEWSTTLHLVAGHRYRLAVDWFAVVGQPFPALGLADVSHEIAKAVQAARRSTVAVVFASTIDSEGIDNPDLSLPGDANALIAAVAAANPRTVVVLNTGGAVVMPWLRAVSAVVEAWYPGQEDGTATAAVLDGHVDPGGHLPITFPAAANPSTLASASQYPGVDGTAHYLEGLDIGYRWYQAKGVTPQFPFGFGLSYTSFALSGARLGRRGADVVAQVHVTDTGRRAGTAVVQAYVHYPAAADEPPEQLRAFDAVKLTPGQTRQVSLRFKPAAFEAFRHDRFERVGGRYGISLGQSSADLPVHLSLDQPAAPAAA